MNKSFGSLVIWNCQLLVIWHLVLVIYLYLVPCILVIYRVPFISNLSRAVQPHSHTKIWGIHGRVYRLRLIAFVAQH
jgi:hypothetical protein